MPTCGSFALSSQSTGIIFQFLQYFLYNNFCTKEIVATKHFLALSLTSLHVSYFLFKCIYWYCVLLLIRIYLLVWQ